MVGLVGVCETQAHLMSVAIIKRVSNGLLVQGQGKYYDKLTTLTTLFMVFSVLYIICEGPKLDAYRSQSVMSANCQYDIIVNISILFE